MLNAKTKAFLQIMRIPQWVKNAFIFLPAFFGGAILLNNALPHLLLAFTGFSLVASSVYILNDWKDQVQDRLHPEKKNRPLAAGNLSSSESFSLGALLFTGGSVLVYFIDPIKALYILCSYTLLNIAYTFFLKHYPILDVLTIAFGFVIRLLMGSAVTDVALSPWIIITTFLLALFLALAKRRNDVLLFTQTNEKTRNNIDGYNLEFLNAAIIMTAAIVMVTYVMYTVSPEVYERTGTHPYITAIFVLAAMLRYLQLTFVQHKSGNPTRILFSDWFLQLMILAWVISFIYTLYIK